MNHSPDFIIIGAMKCATSTLHEQLAVQPGIFMTDLKEPNFFSNDENYTLGMDWYESHFVSAPTDALCGESSTHYTKLPTYPQTVDRLHQHLPDVKLIYVMRHPIDRLISQYIHEWSQRIISVKLDRAISSHPELIDYSKYTMQLAPYFKIFGQERILPVFFERVLSHPQEELERICRFISYPNQPNWVKDLRANESSERMRKNPLRDFFVEAPGLREIRQAFIPKSFRTRVRGWWTMKNKPKLSPEQREQLQNIFDEDLACLGSLLGRSLSCENFKETVRSNSIDWEQKISQSSSVP